MTTQPSPDSTTGVRRWGGWLWIGALLLVGFVVAKAARTERQKARDSVCRGMLTQIAVALDNYSNETGVFTPLILKNERGDALFSWRALLLPYVDGREAYAELDLSQKWDNPKNVAVAKRFSSAVARRFHSPNDFSSNADETSFVAIEFSETPTCDRRFVIVEVHNTGIHWSEPRDLSPTEIQSRISDMLSRGQAVHVLTDDLRVGTIADSSLTFYGPPGELFRWITPAPREQPRR